MDPNLPPIIPNTDPPVGAPSKLAKLKDFWFQLPKRARILCTIAVVIVASTVTIIALSQSPNPAIREAFRRFIPEQLQPSAPDDGFVKLTIPEREPAFFVLTPTKQTKYGLAPQTSFTLTTKSAVDAQFIKDHLESKIVFTLTQVNDTQFTLTPVGPLATDEVFSVALAVKDTTASDHNFDRNYGWTYQTQGKFRVVSTIPGNEKKSVPVNTGLEFTFSQDDYADPTPFISITPKVEFRIERHSETLSIVPLKPLNPRTIYTLTLKRGLSPVSRRDPISEDTVVVFQTADPPVADVPAAYFSLSEDFVQFTPSEPPAVKVYESNWDYAKDSIAATVYRFTSPSAFLDSRSEGDKASTVWFDYFPQDKPVDMSGAVKIFSVDLKIQTRNETKYLQLPQGLEEGYYIVEFKYANNQKLQRLWVQSTNVSSYVSVGKEQTIVWVHDNATALPIGTAQAKVVGDSGSFYTSDNGVALFPTPRLLHNTSRHYIEISKAGYKSLYLPVSSLSEQTKKGDKRATDYWTYFYHERRMYKPTDTFYFWGVVKDRDTNVAPSTIKVKMARGYDQSNASVVFEKSFDVSQASSVIGSFSFADLPVGWYSIQYSAGDTILDTDSVEITDYVKPELKIETSADKKAIFTSETVKVVAKVAFFDGTPAKDFDLKITESHGGKQTEVKTNNQGEVVYNYTPHYSGNSTEYPRYESVTIIPARAQQALVEGFASVFVFGSRLTLTTDSSQDEQHAVFNGQVNVVDLTGINSTTSSETKGDPKPNHTVGLTNTKTWWEKKERGTYYDFIEKVTYPLYDYIRHDEAVTDTKLTTNAEGRFSYSFDMEVGKSYQVTSVITDQDGHTVSGSQYYYYYEGWSRDGDQGTAEPTLTLGSTNNAYSIGDSVTANIQVNGKELTDTDKANYLFIVATRGVQDYFQEDEPRLTFAFGKKHVPNAYIGAVIFTGSYYKNVSAPCQYRWYCRSQWDPYTFDGAEIRYKSDDSKLSLSITNDKQSYLPGSEAKISVKVTNKDGNPSPNTVVNLAVVDEAMEAIGGVIKPSVLDTLYASIPSEIYYSYFSHKPVLPDPHQAEMGGGGGGARELFKDTPFFSTGVTNESGDVTFTFTLPDNITTWLTYAQAADNTLLAGQTEGKLIATKAFFVTSQFPRVFLTSDKPQLAASSAGILLGQQDSVDYEMQISRGDELISKSAKKAQAFTESVFDFSPLIPGEYKVALFGKAKGQEDGVSYPLNVIDSRVSIESDKTTVIPAGSQKGNLVPPGFDEAHEVTLTITDEGRGKFYYQLAQYCYLPSNRLEKQLAAIQASRALVKVFGQSDCSANIDLKQFQGSDGGLSQVVWGSSNLETTVWSLLVDRSSFDTTRLTNFLEAKANETGYQTGSTQKLYAYWGLTLLGKPYYAKLVAQADMAANLDEKLIAAIALASVGEIEKARDVYYDILADYGYTNAPYIRIQRPSDTSLAAIDQRLKDSGYALLIGSLVEQNYNKGLYAYMRDWGSEYIDVVLDLATIEFDTHELAKLPNEDTSVTVKTPLKTSSYTLTKGRSIKVKLAQGEPKDTIVQVDKGKAEVTAVFTLVSKAIDDVPKDNRLKLTRSLNNTNGADRITTGDIVKVTLDYDANSEAPLGKYKIVDHIPSGFTYLANPYNFGQTTKGWIHQSADHITTGYFYNSTYWQKHKLDTQFVYFLRASAPGTYQIEPAIMMSSEERSVVNTAPSTTITIHSR